MQFKLNPLMSALGVCILILGGAYLLFGAGPKDKMNNEDMNGSPIAQSHRSYELQVTSNTDDIKPGQPTRVTFKVKNDLGEILKDFAVVHEKIMHFILVRKDLQQFQHLHPDYDKATGEFAIKVTFPTDGPYRLFPDFTPGKSVENSQLLPVTLFQDVTVGNLGNYRAQSIVQEESNIKTMGDYKITYKVPEMLRAQSSNSYTLTVTKNGQPVRNLQTYLGAMGHSVILMAGTLDFIHAHAESESGGGPDITFSTSFPEPGLYKTFTQFQHEGKVLTSDFVVSVGPANQDAMPEDMMDHNVH